MKLLLTSAGISNKAIGASLIAMLDKPVSEAKVGFIAMAANVEPGNKDWLINQYLQLWRYGFSWIDIVDPSSADVDWRTRLAEVDILYLSGGNTFHLLDQVRKTGFDTWLQESIETKIYVGGSASTILMTPSIAVAGLEPGDENTPGLEDVTGLGYVDFEIEPHCDAERLASVKSYAETTPNALYAIDDESAVSVVDGETKVISRGSWVLYER